MALTPPDRKYAQDGTEILFVRRWNTLVSALIIEPTVKLVARTVVDYGLADGQGIYPGNERIARQTGFGPETVRKAWGILRGVGMAERVTSSYYDGSRRTADEYELVIPGNWRTLPVYGPNLRRFHCQQCGKVFDPQAGTVQRTDGSVGWSVHRMAFCPKPGAPRKRADGTKARKPPPWCYEVWGQGRSERTRFYGPDCDAWELFRRARGDDWPTASQVGAADQAASGIRPDLRLA
jgi:rubredoxin